MVIPLLQFFSLSTSDRLSKVPEYTYLIYSVLNIGKVSTMAILVGAVTKRIGRDRSLYIRY